MLLSVILLLCVWVLVMKGLEKGVAALGLVLERELLLHGWSVAVLADGVAKGAISVVLDIG